MLCGLEGILSKICVYIGRYFDGPMIVCIESIEKVYIIITTGYY